MAILTGRRASFAVMLAAWLGASDASAQVFGTFSWRMEPYCNVVTLTITQFPGGYTLDGNDNQCGTGKLASATGQALINPDGTVGLDFTIITSPSGKDVHVAALISPANGSGTWTDSVGNIGTFLLGVAGAGSPRPLPASGLGVAVITTTEIAAGAVGASDINTAEVQARVTGACTAGQVLTGINANGMVACAPAVQMLTNNANGNNPNSTTAFPSNGFVNFVGPTVTVTLAAGQKAYMNVVKALGTTLANAIDLDIFPCARLASAANTVQATVFGGGIFNLTTTANNRIPMSINFVYTTSNLPGGQAFAVGMCARFTNIANQTNWNSNEFGYISVLVENAQ